MPVRGTACVIKPSPKLYLLLVDNSEKQLIDTEWDSIDIKTRCHNNTPLVEYH